MVKRRFVFLILSLIGVTLLTAQIPYSVANKKWGEELGNHRVVIKTSGTNDFVYAKIPWRRRDADPEKKRLIIQDEKGQLVKNIKRVQINREVGEIIFQAIPGATIYYVYYMPYSGNKTTGSWKGNYLGPEDLPGTQWLQQIALAQQSSSSIKHNTANILKFESRTAFDNFFPMEVCATAQEVARLKDQYKQAFLLFPEDRLNPIRMTDDLPYRWIQKKPDHTFTGNALRNEYYVFQIGMFATSNDLKKVAISYAGSNKVTCFNTGGVNAEGKLFSKQLDITKDKVQALWFGVDIPENQKPGVYAFDVIITAENASPQKVSVKLNISKNILKDRGDSELWRLSRLRWLNSALGIDDKTVAPYTAINQHNNTLQYAMGSVQLNEFGFPQFIHAGTHSILHTPIRFLVETDNGTEQLKATAFKYTKRVEGKICWQAEAANETLSLVSDGEMEFDGTISYSVKVKALKNVQVRDIKLEIPVKKQVAQYFMGMGLPGKECPPAWQWKWNGPQDSYWIGTVAAGLHCELRGASYSGPLLNLYKPEPPPSWFNANKGGFEITSTDSAVLTTSYSGARSFSLNETVDFQFRLLITPVKKINTKDQFENRYYHNGQSPAPALKDVAAGIKIINVHHGNSVNPYINYPFIAVDTMKRFVNRWHEQGVKVKIYYTIRELTNQAPEIWALRSLGNEILGGGPGGGFPWLQEHLVNDYNVQWFTTLENTDAVDAAIITSAGQSRWFNYYIEGLRWLVKNVDIDGLYLDDVTFDREMLKRIRKVMNDVKPGCLLDLHSNTEFSNGPANQYTEFFPFIDKLWFGESFKYDAMPPDNWLVEVSGIPFGLMGDMLHAGGNAWRGMIYGMTVRYPWYTEGVSCDPRDIWKVWDSFGIADAKMIGYWEDHPPITTSNEHVKVTSYVKNGKVLIALASWAAETTSVSLNIDKMALGLGDKQLKLVAPGIPAFQEARTFKLNDSIPVEPKKGWLFVLE